MVEKTDENFRGKTIYKKRCSDGDIRKFVSLECNYSGCDEEYLKRVTLVKRGEGKYCSRSCAAKKRAENTDQQGENNPNWKGGVSDEPYRYKLRQKERHPEKVRARRTLGDKVRQGKIERKPCELCGSEDDVHGHHEDYDNPLEVNWVCRTHHREYHESKFDSFEEYKEQYS